MQELAEQLGMLMPMGGGRQYRFSGDSDEALSMSEAMQVMEQLDELEKLERELNAARRGESLDDIDREQLGDLLGADAQQALDQLQRSRQTAGGRRLPRMEGQRNAANPACHPQDGSESAAGHLLLPEARRFRQAPHRIRGRGGERTYDTKPYEFGDPFDFDLQRHPRQCSCARKAQALP